MASETVPTQVDAARADTEPLPLPTGHGTPPSWTSPAVAVRLLLLAAFGAAVLAVPVLVSPVYLNVLARAAVFALVALSMNVLVGYTGQVSLGHNAFVGIGAFTAGNVLSELGLPFAVALSFAAATGALAALILGAVALRVRGLYLALVTLAYGLFAQHVLFNIRAVTGGGSGTEAPRPGLASADLTYVYLCIAFVVAVVLFDRALTSSRPGRAIQALRDDERVAASWGVNVTAYKLLAFVISGGIAGLAGGLFAAIEGVVVAADFEITVALTFLLMTVLGGVRSRIGVIQGAVFVALLPTILGWTSESIAVPPFPYLTPSAAPVIVALLVILVLTLAPGGIAQLERPVLRWFAAGRARRTASHQEVRRGAA